MSKWKMVRLGDVATYVNGYAFKPSEWSMDGLPIIRIQNLTGNAYETNYFNNYYNPKYEVNNGDILISWSASLGVYEWSSGKALLNQHIFKVVFNKINVDKKYYLYALNSILEKVSGQTHGSTMKHITKPRFDSLPFPLPPLEDQKKIAAELDKINELIAKRKKQIEKLDLLIKSQFVEMFGDNNFKVKLLKDMCLKITDGTHQSPKFIQYGIPFLFISNIVNNKIVYETNKFIEEEEYNILIKRTPIEIGDILLTTVGSYGNPAIVESEYKFCFQRHIGYIKPKKEILNSYFLKYYFISPKGKEEIENRVKGIAQKTLNLSELKDMPIQLPPMPLQIKFADFVAKVEQTKSNMQIALGKLETLYKARMQEYFN